MKIQYLGTAAAEGIPAIFCECENCKKSRELGGRNIRTRSQAIIDDTILIDFPADTYMHFLNFNMPLHKINTCIITHSHGDHLYPADISMRANGCFAHVISEEPLTFYSDESGYEMIKNQISDMSDKDVQAVRIKPFEAFDAQGYRITPIRATHDPASTPVVYVIEKDGKSIFYANDSGEYSDESMACLKKLSKPLTVVSFDCTSACDDNTYFGHPTFNRCKKMRELLIDEKIVDKDTIFVLNHFSHNGAQVVYDEFSKIAAGDGFLVSYDGMVLEF